jgi:ubiquitin C-terminal hydrolase
MRELTACRQFMQGILRCIFSTQDVDAKMLREKTLIRTWVTWLSSLGNPGNSGNTELGTDVEGVSFQLRTSGFVRLTPGLGVGVNRGGV